MRNIGTHRLMEGKRAQCMAYDTAKSRVEGRMNGFTFKRVLMERRDKTQKKAASPE